jgi:hypothetical protein
VSDPFLTHLEATAVQVILAGRPVKILAAYLLPSCPQMGWDRTACFGGVLPVLMESDLNAKQLVLNSRLTKRRGKRLRDYAEEYFCSLDRKPQSPTHTPPLQPIFWTAWRMSKRIMRFPTLPPRVKQGNHFLRPEKAEVLDSEDSVSDGDGFFVTGTYWDS